MRGALRGGRQGRASPGPPYLQQLPVRGEAVRLQTLSAALPSYLRVLEALGSEGGRGVSPGPALLPGTGRRRPCSDAPRAPASPPRRPWLLAHLGAGGHTGVPLALHAGLPGARGQAGARVAGRGRWEGGADLQRREARRVTGSGGPPPGWTRDGQVSGSPRFPGSSRPNLLPVPAAPRGVPARTGGREAGRTCVRRLLRRLSPAGLPRTPCRCIRTA